MPVVLWSANYVLPKVLGVGLLLLFVVRFSLFLCIRSSS